MTKRRRRTKVGKGRMEDEERRVKVRMIGKRRMEFGKNRTVVGKRREYGRGGESVSIGSPAARGYDCPLCAV